MKEQSARDIMTSPAVTVNRTATLEEAAADTMLDRDVKHVPVVDEGGRPVGLVARHDLLKMLASSRGLATR